MKTINNISLYFTYFLVFCIVERGMFFESIVPLPVAKALFVAVSLITIILNPISLKTILSKFLFAFIILISIWFLLSDYIWLTYYTNTITALIAFFPFYNYSRKGLISEKQFLVFLLILFVIITISYRNVFHQSSLINKTDFFTINYGYFFATILPLVFLLRKKWLQYILIIICIIGAVDSTKRGAIIITLFSGIYFFYNAFKSNLNKKNFYYLFLIIIALYLAYSYVYKIMLQSEGFLLRYARTLEGDSSGRDEIMNRCVDYLSHEGDWRLLIGNGFFSTISIIGIEAHNDWLEIVIDYGIIGLVIYVGLIVSLYNVARKSKNSQSRFVLLFILLTWIMKSIFSMQYCNINSILMLIALGIVLGNQNKDENSLSY